MRVKNLRTAPVEINWHSGLPIFASEPFLKTVGDEYGWVGGSDDSRQLRCVLPYTVIRKIGFRIIRFRVETIPMEGELHPEEERSFLNGTIEYFRSRGADLIIPASNTALFRTYPEGAVAAPYGTFIKDLRKPEEALFNEISLDYRKKIRRATREGVHVESGDEYLDASYGIIQHALARSGVKSKSYEDFKSLVRCFGKNVRIFVAKYRNVVQACLVIPFSEHSAYTLYGGTVLEPHTGAMHLLHWEGIRQIRGLGVRQFNFTGVRIDPEKGSKQEGIMTFKMRFGGRLVQGYTWKYSLHPLKFVAYSVAIRLLRGGDIVDLEHHKLASA